MTWSSYVMQPGRLAPIDFEVSHPSNNPRSCANQRKNAIQSKMQTGSIFICPQTLFLSPSPHFPPSLFSSIWPFACPFLYVFLLLISLPYCFSPSFGLSICIHSVKYPWISPQASIFTLFSYILPIFSSLIQSYLPILEATCLSWVESFVRFLENRFSFALLAGKMPITVNFSSPR